MPSPLATVFSLIDQMKRNLSPRGMKSTIDQTVFDLGQLQKQMETAQGNGPDAAAAQRAVTEKMLNAVLNFAPGGIGAQILLHGGPKSISTIDPQQLGKVGQIFGPGFYLSDKSITPITYARNARDVGEGKGVVSVFNLPDELYARTLQLSDKPIAQQPELAAHVSTALNSNKQLFDRIMAQLQGEVKYQQRKNPAATPTSTLTGEWLDSVLNDELGRAQAAQLLAKSGIPGKTWDAGKGEMHTVVFPEYLNQLEAVGSAQLMPTQSLIENTLKAIIKDYEATK